MDADRWATLPCDLLIEILRRLAPTTIVRCGSTCRPWRRAIIGNSSSLRPRSDRFNPNLLIGFFYGYCWSGSYHARLHYVPAPLEDMDMWAKKNHSLHYTRISFFIPPSSTNGVGIEQYDNPLSSCDGFLLLGGGSESKMSDLCLCNPLAGTCRSIHAATLGVFRTCTYVLITDNDTATVWVLAVRREENVKRGLIYQIFPPNSGEWGPVKQSARFEKGVARADMTAAMSLRNSMVVSRGAVYWLVRLFSYRQPRRSSGRCVVFAIDVRTEQTWMTELPEERKVQDTRRTFNNLILATSENDRLSLIVQRVWDHRIEVWVLTDDGRWTLRRVIDTDRLIPDCPKDGKIWFLISGFYPRSGCLFGDFDHKDFLSDVNSGLLRPTGRNSIGRVSKYPYEMDWSLYLSKMKYF
ncbi:unnamed protein product [Urochloa humidicola]